MCSPPAHGHPLSGHRDESMPTTSTSPPLKSSLCAGAHSISISDNSGLIQGKDPPPAEGTVGFTETHSPTGNYGIADSWALAQIQSL